MEKIRDALVSVTTNTYHYHADPKADVPYIVWKEDGRNDLLAAGEHVEKAWTGVIDLYTKEENDPFVYGVETALSGVGAAWSLVSVDYEEETGRIHYSWDWEIEDGNDQV